ncbi:MAG: amphi-Trp domain-containing protein [Actinobacteria bacterium]|nr:amphi-Trp domain-containing protein [Actinomycetota bacterium]
MSEHKTRLFKSEVPQTRMETANFLRELADKVATGTVVLKRSGEEWEVVIPEHVVLEVQLDKKSKSGKGVKHSLEIEIEWYEGGAGAGPVELG